MTYVALPRGINVGGVTVKMMDLKKLLETAGFKNVKTLLASGNVLLDSTRKDARGVAGQIEKALEAKYKRVIRVVVRPIHDIEMLVKGQLFKRVVESKDTRLYVTFLGKAPKTHLKLKDENFRVVKTCPFAVSWVLEITAERGTVDVMTALEKHYGKDITTRNWNTVQKILKATVDK